MVTYIRLCCLNASLGFRSFSAIKKKIKYLRGSNQQYKQQQSYKKKHFNLLRRTCIMCSAQCYTIYIRIAYSLEFSSSTLKKEAAKTDLIIIIINIVRVPRFYWYSNFNRNISQSLGLCVILKHTHTQNIQKDFLLNETIFFFWARDFCVYQSSLRLCPSIWYRYVCIFGMPIWMNECHVDHLVVFFFL